MVPNRPYLYVELTNSICFVCLKKIEAKIIFENENVFLVKRCAQHGFQKILISTDIPYFKRTREFIKPSEMPLHFNTPITYGCPYDCGLCPDHEQHSCLTIVEITDECNLECPICYAESSPKRKTMRSLEDIERMFDIIVRNEGEPDIVQLSGGEPTLHPRFFEILAAAKKRPIRHLMVNTNGIRIAQDLAFVEKLRDFIPGFEIYLQFDSLRAGPIKDMRGTDLTLIRKKAIENLNRSNISTTLVVTLKKGINDDEIGDIVRFGLEQRCVRGVTFQPIQAAGRLERFDPAKDRLTLSEVRRNLISQSNMFLEADVLPVPCHPDCIAMAYALKTDQGPIPLTRFINSEELITSGRNTIVYEGDRALQEKIFSLFSTSHSPTSSASSLKSLLCCLPRLKIPDQITYDRVFRVILMQFMDAYSFDVRSVKKSCVHIAHPDGRLIPFDTYNLFYRDDKEKILRELVEAP